MSAAYCNANEARLVVVANRLPVHRSAAFDPAQSCASPGGLVSALRPVLRRAGGSWIGWIGHPDDLQPPYELEGIRQVPIALSPRDIDGFYEGFSNRTLWPLYHDAVRRPRFERRWWTPYVSVNRRFAERAADEAGPGAAVWVQDYHLQLVPRMLRQMRPDVRIGFFLHIPFPPQELFAQLPWRRPLLEGLLGADLFGCHTRLGARNFAELAVRYASARPGEEEGELHYDGRRVRYGAFPISIDVERFESLARSAQVRERARQIRGELGEQRRLVLGIDRLDYTKGIDIRLRAYGALLDRGRVSAEGCVLLQTAVPSRENVREYVSMRRRIEALVGRINGRHGRIGRVAVHYLHQSLEPEELVALYVAADVMLVTPLRDGMNLIAKEYVASRVGEDGVLVLSEFTGAAHELTAALVVNPHDEDGLARTIYDALNMPRAEATDRMRRLRSQVAAHDVHRWAREFLGTLHE
ncbi:MAG: trehalose-6-phosphate synthase [Deltaproteobacteria bacterium]|nr:trehalose-6-phosphate synthase [Deltaproteobacteria bacterium]